VALNMKNLLGFLRQALAIGGLLFLSTSVAQTNESSAEKLRIGVVPNVSARIIATNYQPLAEYFRTALKRDTEITTGANFPNFHQRALNQEFEIMVTAPNLGRVAQLDGNWRALAVFEPGVPGLLVGLSGQDHDLSKLKGKKLALSNPQSLVALVGVDWLKNQGYQAGTNYQTMTVANDDSLGVVLKSGEAPFAMMSMGEFNSKNPELKKQLTVVTEFVRLPGFMFMVSAKMSDADKAKIEQLLQAFPASELGKKFLALNSFTGLKVPTDAQTSLLDQYVDVTRKGLSIKK